MKKEKKLVRQKIDIKNDLLSNVFEGFGKCYEMLDELTIIKSKQNGK